MRSINDVSSKRYWRARLGHVVMYHGRSCQLALEYFHQEVMPKLRQGMVGVCEVQEQGGDWRRVVGAEGRRPVKLCGRCGGDGTIEQGLTGCPWCEGRGVMWG